MAWKPSVLSSQALTSAAWQAEGSLTTGPRVMLSARIRLLAPPPSYSTEVTVQYILTITRIFNLLLNILKEHIRAGQNNTFKNILEITVINKIQIFCFNYCSRFQNLIPHKNCKWPVVSNSQLWNKSYLKWTYMSNEHLHKQDLPGDDDLVSYFKYKHSWHFYHK